jgi:hypothetical protein
VRLSAKLSLLQIQVRMHLLLLLGVFELFSEVKVPFLSLGEGGVF